VRFGLGVRLSFDARLVRCLLPRANDPIYRLLRAPTTAYRKTNEQDQCHHGRGCHRAERGARHQSVGGSFLASRPGSFLASVEALMHKSLETQIPWHKTATVDAESGSRIAIAQEQQNTTKDGVNESMFAYWHATRVE
jgi:hypothetical protein